MLVNLKMVYQEGDQIVTNTITDIVAFDVIFSEEGIKVDITYSISKCIGFFVKIIPLDSQIYILIEEKDGDEGIIQIHPPQRITNQLRQVEELEFS